VVSQEIAIHLAHSYCSVLQSAMEEIATHSAHGYYDVLQNVMEMKLNNWSVKLLLKHSAFYRD